MVNGAIGHQMIKQANCSPHFYHQATTPSNISTLFAIIDTLLVSFSLYYRQLELIIVFDPGESPHYSSWKQSRENENHKTLPRKQQ
jgi:hypothetical protein